MHNDDDLVMYKQQVSALYNEILFLVSLVGKVCKLRQIPKKEALSVNFFTSDCFTQTAT